MMISISFISFLSCTPMDHYYADFIPESIKIYPGKIDSIVIKPGLNRMILSASLSHDPRIEKMKVYWNNKKDSVEFNVVASEVGKKKNVLINMLPEGNYNFEIFTFDNLGTKSVKAEAFGYVYGEKYINNLNNRIVSSSGYSGTDAVFIQWIAETDTTFIGTKLTYTDKGNNKIVNIIPRDEARTQILQYKPGSEIYYQSMYIPEPLAIDTFYSNSKTIIIN